jgi:phosphoglucomutase
MKNTQIYLIKQAVQQKKLLPSAAKAINDWLSGTFLPDWGKKALSELIEQGAWEELSNRFYSDIQFGTGGMRGRTIAKMIMPSELGNSSNNLIPQYPGIGTNCMNAFTVMKATEGLFSYAKAWLKSQKCKKAPSIVIAHDVRHFSADFSKIAASVWSSLGGTAYLFDGPRSTPQLSYTVRALHCTVGVVITASHNPSYDNGYKVYFSDGGQVVEPHATGITESVKAQSWKGVAELDLKNVKTVDPVVEKAYRDVVFEVVLDKELIHHMHPKIAYTPLHGTGGVQVPAVLNSAGACVIMEPSQFIMDGSFPTVSSPNPENPQALELGIKLAKLHDCDAVLATDPDADRMGCAVRTSTGEYQPLTGNLIACVLADYRLTKMKKLGWLPKKGTKRAVIIKSLVTTPLLSAIAKYHGVRVIETLTGFKYMGDKLGKYEAKLIKNCPKIDLNHMSVSERVTAYLKHSTYCVFAAEESYGTLACERVRDKDANAGSLMMAEWLAFLKKTKQTAEDYLNNLYQRHGFFAEGVVNLIYEGSSGVAKIQAILKDYRTHPPKEFAGFAVKQIFDFGKQTLLDSDDEVIPSQDFFILELSGNLRIAVRASGTEPKIKYYTFAYEPAGKSLNNAKALVHERLEQLRNYIAKNNPK